MMLAGKHLPGARIGQEQYCWAECRKQTKIKGNHEPYRLDRKRLLFFLFSREESRKHIHVTCAAGEAKYWLEPEIELANNHGLPRQQLKEIETIIERHFDEFRSAWASHLGG
jgi:hypothetical protein